MSLLKALMPAIAALSSPAQATPPATPPAINDPMLKFEQQQMFQPQVPPDVNAPPKYPSLLAPKQMNLTDQLKPLQQIQQEAADKYIAEKEALTQDRSEEVRTILEQTQATKNRVPYKYLVLHKPGLNNKDETVAFMQKKGVGYNELFNQAGLNIRLGSPDLRTVHIKQPTHPERLAKTIKEQRPDITNENAYGFAVWGGLNEKTNPRLFERIAEIYAKEGIPLERMVGKKMLPNYPVGHGQIQHSPEGAKYARQTLSKGKEEGSDLQKLFIDNWDTFGKLVNKLKEQK